MSMKVERSSLDQVDLLLDVIFFSWGGGRVHCSNHFINSNINFIHLFWYNFDKVKARFNVNKRKMEEKKKDYDFDQRMVELKEEEERAKEYKKEKRKVYHHSQLLKLI